MPTVFLLDCWSPHANRSFGFPRAAPCSSLTSPKIPLRTRDRVCQRVSTKLKWTGNVTSSTPQCSCTSRSVCKNSSAWQVLSPTCVLSCSMNFLRTSGLCSGLSSSLSHSFWSSPQVTQPYAIPLCRPVFTVYPPTDTYHLCVVARAVSLSCGRLRSCGTHRTRQHPKRQRLLVPIASLGHSIPGSVIEQWSRTSELPNGGSDCLCDRRPRKSCFPAEARRGHFLGEQVHGPRWQSCASVRANGNHGGGERPVQVIPAHQTSLVLPQRHRKTLKVVGHNHLRERPEDFDLRAVLLQQDGPRSPWWERTTTMVSPMSSLVKKIAVEFDANCHRWPRPCRWSLPRTLSTGGPSRNSGRQTLAGPCTGPTFVPWDPEVCAPWQGRCGRRCTPQENPWGLRIWTVWDLPRSL